MTASPKSKDSLTDHGIVVGMDIGAVSITAAIVVPPASQPPAEAGEFVRCQGATGESAVFLSGYRRTKGQPVNAAQDLLAAIGQWLGAELPIDSIALTGSGTKAVADAMAVSRVNEFRAIAAGLELLGCEAKTVFEMGGESSKYLRLDERHGIVDYATNGDCAAGTGSFIDQQCNRLKYCVEDLSEIVSSAQRAAQVAGRCSVFAKSDMIHAQQKGYTPAEVLRGLCGAVARNYRAAVVRSHPVEAPVAFIGGVTENTGVVDAIRETFELADGDLIVPPAQTHVPALGAAALAAADLAHPTEAHPTTQNITEFPRSEKLTMDNVLLLRDRVGVYEPNGHAVPGFMGIDIGSVSTNVVVVDTAGQVLAEIYTRTQGRPIEVVTKALRQIRDEWGEKLDIRGVGTTGSGRELIGELVGADTINDEITAHKTGATFIGQTLLAGRTPDTIFEIGGQDSKYIHLQDGVVVDFTMNEACAAGTGSFLEERAEELGISIKDEFASLALSSDEPIRLGERCTVFMERDVTSYLQRGANKPDLVAGLAYSVVQNYINRVVRDRPIGECIFFQGGTAYNDAVAAAFAEVTGKEIIVPPHNGVMGAIGVALLARAKMSDSSTPSAFRGYDLSQVSYDLREFTCKGCTNACQIQEFSVEGNKTYWGDKCSDRFRKQVKTDRAAEIDDLFAMREDLLLADKNASAGDGPRVGIPMTMWAFQQLPFWRTLLENLGCQVVLSEPTRKTTIARGLDSVVAEPCFPIIVAHGHVENLADKDVDAILMPNIISLDVGMPENKSHLCPWHQTLPFVTRRSPALRELGDKFWTPTVHFRQGLPTVTRQLAEFFTPLGYSMAQVRQATQAAQAAQDTFETRLKIAGMGALDQLARSGQPGLILVGRPYNVHDAGMNLSIPSKLRAHYGCNCIPMDCLDVADVDIDPVNPNMYWALGRRILQTARFVADWPNLHIIYITNFKCGPDSYIKQFIRKASGKPFLTLQFDGHSNDAGMMTRCEAYLDSKGILRPTEVSQPETILAGQ